MARTIQVVRKKSKGSSIITDPLAQKKLIWTVGHCICLIFGVLFSITYFYHVLHFYKYRQWKWLFLRVNKSYAFMAGRSWFAYFVSLIPQFLYRGSLIGFLISSYISLDQTFVNSNPTWYDLLCSEGFQAAGVAIVWLLGGRKSFYRLCPFIIISYLHIMNRKNEFTNNQKGSEEFAAKYYKLLRTIGYIESMTLVALIFDTFMLKDGTSGFSLVFYIGLFWLRLNFNPYARITTLKTLGLIKPHLSDVGKKYVSNAEHYLFLKIKQDRLRRSKY